MLLFFCEVRIKLGEDGVSLSRRRSKWMECDKINAMDCAHETTKTVAGEKNRFISSAVRKICRTVFGNNDVDDGKIPSIQPTKPLLDTHNNRVRVFTLLCAERQETAGNVGR